MKLLEAFRNIFRIPDLRNRVLFTLALLAVYRIGAFIPTPGINTKLIARAYLYGVWPPTNEEAKLALRLSRPNIA